MEPGGLLIGRSADAQLILSDQRASRRHALVRLGGNGPEVLPLGRQPVLVNQKPAHQGALLKNGDVLGFPGLNLTVCCDWVRPARPVCWAVLCDTVLLSLNRPVFYIGDHERDHFFIPGLGKRAITCEQVAAGLMLSTRQPASLNDAEPEVLSLLSVRVGDVLRLDQVRLQFLKQSGDSHTTLSQPSENFLRLIQVKFLPRGGALVLQIDDDCFEIGLSELRTDLVAALLQPGGQFKPGDFIPDMVLANKIWPGQGRGREHINLLVFRFRKALVQQGVDPNLVIERVRSGRGTRLILHPDTVVKIN